MQLFKVDTDTWTVRPVDGEQWPGMDSEGDRCFDNTHFVSETKAWAKLEAEAGAWQKLSVSALCAPRDDLAKAEKQVTDAALAVVKVAECRPRAMSSSCLSFGAP